MAYYQSRQLVAFIADGVLMGSQKVCFNATKSTTNAILNQDRTGLTETNALYMISAQRATSFGGDSIKAVFTNIKTEGVSVGYEDGVDKPGNGRSIGGTYWLKTMQALTNQMVSQIAKKFQKMPK